MFSRLFRGFQFHSHSRTSSSTAPSSRLLRLEPLEARALLSVGEISAPTTALVSEYVPVNRPEESPIPLDALVNVSAATGSDLGSPQTAIVDAPIVSGSKSPANVVELTWNEVVGANRYTVYRSASLDGPYAPLASVDDASYVDAPVKGAVYYYMVGAELYVDGQVQSSQTSDAISVDFDVPNYKLDVNFKLDAKLLYEQGVTDIKESNIGSFDVYVNGELYAENVGDFYDQFIQGTRFEIKNLNLNAGYEFESVSSSTSWKGYGIAVGDLSGTVKKVSAGPNEVLLSLATTASYPLDVNFKLDAKLLYEQGITNIKESNIGSFDVYINDELYAKNVGDFYEEFPIGTRFEIKNLNLNAGYEFESVSSRTSWKGYGIAVGALSGTIDKVSAGSNEILLSLATTASYPLDVNFKLDDELLYEQGVTDIKESNIGSFDVYINDELYAENVGDFYEEFPIGTRFEIKNLNFNAGYEFESVSSSTSWKGYGIAVGGLSGTVKKVSAGPNEILLSLATAPIPDPEVAFSLEAGVNAKNQPLELYAPEGCEIYYTTDCSDPVVSPEHLYSEPLALTASASRLAAASNLINVGSHKIYDNNSLPKAVTVKAVAVRPDGVASPIATRTYFLQEREPVAVISISTDYDNLLNYDAGIMVKGAYYDAWVDTPEAADTIANKQYWKYQGNYTQKGKNWERPATFELFDGENYLVENCGIRLRGDASRMYAQKSFAFYFTKDYVVNGLDYALFDDATAVDGNVVSNYKNFIVRNGGNDTEYLKFHDALIQSLAKNLNFATQASRPAVLYLNGEYMGIYVMQERYDGKFFADHYLVDEDAVVLVQEGLLTGGNETDAALYEELQSYANMDLTDPEVYNAFCNVVDIESMIDYYATEIYIANGDWRPAKNTCLWRTRTPENDSFGDGKWRWALYDTEYSSSLYNKPETSYSYDSFTAALNEDPLFAGLVNNPVFYQAFVEKIESLAANDFSSTTVNSALDSFSSVYKPYMSNYYKRYGNTSWVWNDNINGIRDFFANRAQYILNYVENYQQ